MTRLQEWGAWPVSQSAATGEDTRRRGRQQVGSGECKRLPMKASSSSSSALRNPGDFHIGGRKKKSQERHPAEEKAPSWRLVELGPC